MGLVPTSVHAQGGSRALTSKDVSLFAEPVLEWKCFSSGFFYDFLSVGSKTKEQARIQHGLQGRLTRRPGQRA